MITIDSLTRKYGAFTAVDDVTFTAEPGRVTGFLGPNGAGKSTTMRVLVGLTEPTSGHATILGRRFADLPEPGPRGRRTPRRLRAARRPHRPRDPRHRRRRPWACPASTVDEMLERVSLTPEEAGRRVRNYSLGMRQRLGIATALIGDPEVLILDEPANGLDPAGIRWMRDLLRELRRPGRHRAALLAPAARDRGHRRRHRRDRQRPDRRPGHQAGAARRRRHPGPRSTDPTGLARALAAAGIERRRSPTAPSGRLRPRHRGADRLRGRHPPHRAPGGRRRRPGGDVPRR